MIYILLTTTPVLIITFIAAPPVDIDGTCESAHGSLLCENNSISCAIVPTSASIRLNKGLIRQLQGCRRL
jgi:photosystem II P680 reaction center D1 protein